jgi:hypothetical protein
MDLVDHPSPNACLRDYLADGGTLPGIRREINENGMES